MCMGVAARLPSASQTRAPSSGVIIDFHSTGIRTVAELMTGQASCQNPGEAWTRKVSRGLQGLPRPRFHSQILLDTDAHEILV